MALVGGLILILGPRGRAQWPKGFAASVALRSSVMAGMGLIPRRRRARKGVPRLRARFRRVLCALLCLIGLAWLAQCLHKVVHALLADCLALSLAGSCLDSCLVSASFLPSAPAICRSCLRLPASFFLLSPSAADSAPSDSHPHTNSLVTRGTATPSPLGSDTCRISVTMATLGNREKDSVYLITCLTALHHRLLY